MPNSKYDHIMNSLVREFNLDSTQQSKYRRMLRSLEEDSFASGRDLERKMRPEPRKVFKSSKPDISDKQDLYDQQEANWHREYTQAQQDRIEDYSS